MSGDPASHPTATQVNAFRQLTQALAGKRSRESEPALHDPSLYRFRRDSGNDGRAHHRAINPLHALEADFRPDGIRFVEGNAYPVRTTDGPLDDRRAPRLTVRFTGYGTEAAMVPVQEIPFATANDRLERRHGDAVVEWWTNSAAGFEHGFVVESAPHAAAAGQSLRFSFTLESPFAPVFDENHQELIFQTTTGARALTYGGLTVLDGNTAAVPAHLEVGEMTERNGNLFEVPVTLVVDASRATYPLLIDPLISSQMVADINADLEPVPHGTLGERLFFAANSPDEGFELWTSDGTPAGTVRLKDIAPGADSSFPHGFVAVGTTMYFVAFEPVTGFELWKTDGTESGTVLVRDINSGSSSSDPGSFKEFGGALYFGAQSGSGALDLGREFWRSDGTTAGTHLVKDIFAGPGSSDPEELVAVGSSLFFVAHGHDGVTDSGRELWISDGTPVGTVLVKDIVVGSESGSPISLTAEGSRLFFIARSTVWTSDGTDPGTVPLKNFVSYDLYWGGPRLAAFNGLVYFILGTDEFWRSDGTEAGTQRVFSFSEKNVPPFFSPQSGTLARIGNALYFTENGLWRSAGPALWISDGSLMGTREFAFEVSHYALIGNVMLLDVPKIVGGWSTGHPGTDQRIGDSLLGETVPALDGTWISDVAVGEDVNRTYLFVGIPGRGASLWVTDADLAAPTKIAEIDSVTKRSAIGNFCVIGDTVYFAAYDPVFGTELWRSDGTELGTMRLTDIAPRGTATSSPSHLTVAGETLYFIGGDYDLMSSDLWTSDGTPEGTKAVGGTYAPNSVESIIGMDDNTAYFYAKPPGSGPGSAAALWRTDGTESGTYMVEDVLPRESVLVEETLFFTVNIGSIKDAELWKSDGSELGTVLLKAFPLRTTGVTYPAQLTTAGGTLYFLARGTDGGVDTGVELWKSDGTADGTVLVKDIFRGSGSSLPGSLTKVGTTLFFTAHGYDGEVDTGVELWKSDGTPAGTVLVKDICVGSGSSNPESLVAVGGTLFFVNNGSDGITENGIELWKSDGTDAGTVPVKYLAANANGMPPLAAMANVNGLLYFTIHDAGKLSWELWRSDGTQTGTFVLDELGSGPYNSWRESIVAVGSQALFLDDDGIHGTELHSFPGEGADTELTWENVGNPVDAGAQAYFPSLSARRIIAGGADMWYDVDEFRFGHRLAGGDGDLVLRVDEIDGPHPWSRVGLMFRSSLAPDSAHVMLIATQDRGLDLQWRAVNGGPTSHLSGPFAGNPAPVFLKLVRRGRQFTGYQSADGITWTRVESATVDLPWAVEVGILACAINSAAPMRADVSEFSATFDAAAEAPSLNITNLLQVYNGTPRAVAVTATPPGLNFGVSYNGSPLAPTNAGSYPVEARLTDFAVFATGTLVINPADQSIVFAALPDQVFGDPPLELLATASSGLPVAFVVVSGPAQLVGNLLSFSGAGSVTVRATQAGDANHRAALPVDRTVHVAKRVATVSLSGLAQGYTGNSRIVTAVTNPAGLAVTVQYGGAAVAPVATGAYVVDAAIDDPNYIGSATGTLVVAPASQSITFPAPADVVLGAPPFSLGGVSSSGLPVRYELVSGPALLAGSTVTVLGEGVVSIRARQDGDANHAPASAVERSFTVRTEATPLAIATQPSDSEIFDGDSVTLRVVVTGTGPLTYEWFLGASGDVSLPILDATTAELRLDPVIATTSVWVRITNPSGTIDSRTATVTARPTIFTLQPTSVQTYDGLSAEFRIIARVPSAFQALDWKVWQGASDVSPRYSVTGIGIKNVVSTSGSYTEGDYTLRIAPVNDADAGTLRFEVTVNGAHLADGVSRPVQLQVSPGQAPIVATHPIDQKVVAPTTATFAVAANGTPASFTYAWQRLVAGSATWTNLANGGGFSGVATETLSVIPTSVALSGDQFRCVVANGISPSAVSNAARLTVLPPPKIDQSITFAVPADRTYGNAPFALSATASSGLPVSFTLLSGPGILSSDIISLTGAGTLAVRASQPGNDAFNPASSIDRTFTVGKATLTATADNKSRIHGAANPALTISYNGFVLGENAAVLDAPPAISTTAGALSLPGVYPITLTGGSDNNYSFALQNGTLTVTPKLAQTINFVAPADRVCGDAPFALTATASSGLPVSFVVVSGPASVAGSIVTIAGGGTVVVRAEQAGDPIFAAALVERSFVVAKRPATVSLGNLVHLFDGTSKSADAVTTPAGLTVSLTYDGSGIAPSAVGSYAVVATVVDPNHAGMMTGTLVISPIVVAPLPEQVIAGSPIRLRSTIVGNATAYRWQVRGRLARTLSEPQGHIADDVGWVDVPGATNAELMIPAAQRCDDAEYRVIATINGTEVTSQPIIVAVAEPVPNDARLLNLSTRAQALTGDDVLIPGFVVAGTGNKRLLIRAVGPTLGKPPFSLPGVLPDPTMRLLRRNSTTQQFEVIATNDNWGANPNAAAIAQTASDLFAFGLNDALESALLMDLTPGEYTVIASGVGNVTGLAIVELYDADAGTPSSRLINISNRGFAGVGAQVMIPGFVVSTEGPKTLLVRVVGPTLGSFGVVGTMTDPKLEVFPGGASTPILTNDDWSDNPDAAHTAQIAQQVQAFALTAGSKDAAFVVTLQPGSYTVVGSSAVAGGTGVVLVEIYVAP